MCARFISSNMSNTDHNVRVADAHIAHITALRAAPFGH
jgi:hypothetical protein